jgi:hypothetical protein
MTCLCVIYIYIFKQATQLSICLFELKKYLDASVLHLMFINDKCISINQPVEKKKEQV